MIRYLLDTNILSALLREPEGQIGRKIKQVGGAEAVYTSVIVSSEIRFGLAKKRSDRLLAQFDLIVEELSVVPFCQPADRIYADIRAGLERRGTPIGANDLWIAAQALQDGSVLVTDNVKEFGHVPKLKIENWLRS